MKFLAAFILSVVVVSMLGCVGLSEEQQKRLDALMLKNKENIEKLVELEKKAKDGTLTTGEVIAQALNIKEAIAANEAEIKKLKEEGMTTGAVIGGIAATLLRTLLHGATKLPIGGPVGIGIQAILSLLLGGSATQKKEEPAKA